MKAHDSRQFLQPVAKMFARRKSHASIWVISGLTSLLLVMALPSWLRGGVSSSVKDNPERFLSMNSVLRVEKETNVVWVYEVITARVEGKQIKHGFVRQLPKLLPSKGDKPLALAYQIKSILRSGTNSPEQTLPIKTSEDGSTLSLYMGDDKTPLSAGVYEYTLFYSVQGLLEENKGRTYLSWLGSQAMPLSVDKTQVTIVPPQFFSQSDLQGKSVLRFHEIEPERWRYVTEDGPPPAVALSQEERDADGSPKTVLVFLGQPGVMRDYFVQADWPIEKVKSGSSNE